MNKKPFGVQLRCIHNQILRLIYHSDINPSQGRVLVYVNEKTKIDKCYQKDIEQHFHLQSSSATELIKKLIKQNFIHRTVDEHDHRLKKIVMTDLGKQKVESIKVAYQNMEKIIFQQIDESDLIIFNKVLSQIKKNLEKEE